MELRLNDKQVVNCKTEEEAIQCCQLAKSMGLKWRNGDSYDETYWQIRKESMCYVFSTGIHSRLGCLEGLNCQILTAQDFITMHSEPFNGYFESDGTEETYDNIIRVIDNLVPNNRHNTFSFYGDVKGYCYFVKEDEMDCIDSDSIIFRDYHKCNLDHYLHLIAFDLNEILDEDCINAQDDEVAKLKAQIEELKIKADKWDAIPRCFCMRGDKGRGEEIEDMFFKNGYETNNLGFAYKDVIYFGSRGNSQIESISDDTDFAEWFLSTQTLTELPPLEEKEEVEEFWLKYGDKCMYRYTNEAVWTFALYAGDYIDGVILLPFTPETEPLINTTNEPSKKYKFMGVKSYFEKE